MTDAIEIRHNIHPEMARAMDSEALRRHFRIEALFVPGAVRMTYSHIDRLVVAGVVPLADPLPLPTPRAIGQARFFDAREGGVINIGGPGRVVVDGQTYPLAGDAALYISRGAGEVSLSSDDAADPAQFYMVSTPAHKELQTQIVDGARANRLELGAQETANRRTIFQFLHPEVIETCQLTMGLTRLHPGSVWNTMPAHTHDRRSEVYLYFGLPEGQRVFHLMGEPDQTRHIVMANGEAVLSPSWSIHSGAGTSAYAFIWAMAGDNKDFADMDQLRIEDLK
ncbi:5-dehydro-4-deoxy-D-glucuronate isomerase [Frigidibacter albus]|uniref:4-deoxy-L-threo-5-hexosulose-uronate ketol-isomerase n=1 Tax=Frigidibacter albus TaxID=1465486 RepID=A0A6L8VDX9_9RHOB|nr:5-dehydro-4-deoxy-D-glucuronate isomerase [Frigidibacter albus]MZQ88453.1 5-dehydro-4-deoxy-D-glucuronate isomerase [Frigidibacter albus]NBE30738.1 5-dehydro-4-deoxy-D-glucuronate isomerase [Frigidibacter albus]GGH48372.1 4-deoxy-L-threo-5-hexosulose-uronate ketol-isomerase 1 [Frigidibacter albus]